MLLYGRAGGRAGVRACVCVCHIACFILQTRYPTFVQNCLYLWTLKNIIIQIHVQNSSTYALLPFYNGQHQYCDDHNNRQS
jgi:hypothetical protein